MSGSVRVYYSALASRTRFCAQPRVLSFCAWASPCAQTPVAVDGAAINPCQSRRCSEALNTQAGWSIKATKDCPTSFMNAAMYPRLAPRLQALRGLGATATPALFDCPFRRISFRKLPTARGVFRSCFTHACLCWRPPGQWCPSLIEGGTAASS